MTKKIYRVTMMAEVEALDIIDALSGGASPGSDEDRRHTASAIIGEAATKHIDFNKYRITQAALVSFTQTPGLDEAGRIRRRIQ